MDPELTLISVRRLFFLKWPSLGNERRTESTGLYLLVDRKLDECTRSYLW
jgi:hypothetical protein